MLCLPKSKLRYKGSARTLGVPFYAVPFCLRSGRLRGKSCNRKVARPCWACRVSLCPAANAASSELVRVALSVDRCMAFETAFHTDLVGSRCRNFEVRAWSVLVAVPILKWWCLGAVLRLGCAAAVLVAPSCVLRVRLSIDNCVAFDRAFGTVPVRSYRRNFEVREIADCPLGFQTGANGVCRLPGLTGAVPAEV